MVCLANQGILVTSNLDKFTVNEIEVLGRLIKDKKILK
jgi:hypothetical protein